MHGIEAAQCRVDGIRIIVERRIETVRIEGLSQRPLLV